MSKITHFLNSRHNTWILVSHSTSFTLPLLQVKGSLIKNVFWASSTLLSFSLFLFLLPMSCVLLPKSHCLWLGWAGSQDGTCVSQINLHTIHGHEFLNPCPEWFFKNDGPCYRCSVQLNLKYFISFTLAQCFGHNEHSTNVCRMNQWVYTRKFWHAIKTFPSLLLGLSG